METRNAKRQRLAREEEMEEEEEEEEGEEDEEEEVEIVEIESKDYYTNNTSNGNIYSILKDEDVGEIVGVYKNGKPKFF